MESVDLISLARKRWWLLVLAAFIGGGIGLAISVNLPKIYEARATLMVEASISPGDRYSSVLAAERTAGNYAELITRNDNLQRAIDSLDLDYTPDELGQDVSVSAPRDSPFIRLAVRHEDPSMATAIANELIDIFTNDLADTNSSTTNTDLNELRIQVDELRLEVAETESAIDSLSADQADAKEQLASLRDRLREGRVSYASLLASYVQLSALGSGSLPVSVVQQAGASPDVVSPRTQLNVAIAALGGLLLALGAAVVWERWSPRLGLRGDISGLLGIPFLGPAPRPSRYAAQFGEAFVPAPGSLAAKQYARLAQEVQARKLGNPFGSLLVTSPSNSRHGDAVALNLGAALASPKTEVIIVDAHLAAPKLERLLPLAGHAGLRDLLESNGDAIALPDVVQPTAIRGLSVISAGRPRTGSARNGAEDDDLSDVVSALKKLANVIIVDAPPPTKERWVSELAAEVNGVILVVEEDETSVVAARKAKDILTRSGARILGVVVTTDANDETDSLS